jgi:hypothetical protein
MSSRGIRQFGRPLGRDSIGPEPPGLVLSGQEHNQAHLPSRDVRRDLRVKPVLLVDVADQFDGF